jgi:hypothetical protein
VRKIEFLTVGGLNRERERETETEKGSERNELSKLIFSLQKGKETQVKIVENVAMHPYVFCYRMDTCG